MTITTPNRGGGFSRHRWPLKRPPRFMLAILALLSVVTASATAARGCPMCRDSAVIDLTAAQPQQAAAVDFNGGIYAMFAVGGVVVIAAGRAMVRAARG